MFKALRSFKVKSQDGTYRIVKPGEALPEAKTWHNVQVWIRRRWITDEHGNEYDGRLFITGRGPHPSRKVDVGIPREKGPRTKGFDPKKGPPPGHGGGPPAHAGPPMPQPPPTTPPPEDPVAGPPEPTAPAVEGESGALPVRSETDLQKMVKADLQALAQQLGVTVNGKTKPELISAILEAQNG